MNFTAGLTGPAKDNSLKIFALFSKIRLQQKKQNINSVARFKKKIRPSWEIILLKIILLLYQREQKLRCRK